MNTHLHNFSPRKILFCQQRQIGDVVISTACVELLHTQYPDAEIHFLTEHKCAPVLEHNPVISKIWTLKNPDQSDWKTMLQLRKEQFDLAVDPQQLSRTRWATLFSGATVRLATLGKRYKRLFYTHFSNAKTKGGYAGKIKAGVLAPLGIDWNEQEPRMYVSQEEQRWATKHLYEQGCTANDTLITVDATHWSDTRRWPAHHWAGFIQQALMVRPDLRFYLLHGPGERHQVEDIVKLSGKADACLLPPTDTPSLRRTAAVIAQAALQIGNCSAPRHMATALGVPTLTVIGSNGTTAWTFPDKSRHDYVLHKLPCSKCNERECPKGTLECLEGLLPEMVLPQFLRLLG